MQFLKNKHLILAMFVAPTLAVIAYFAVDYVVAEKPQAAMPGQSYKLAAKSNCRYKSGVCTLENGDIEVQLRARRLNGEQLEFILSADMPVQNALISVADREHESQPVVMNAVSPEMDDWHISLNMPSPENSIIRLALNIAGSMYYAETSAVFIDYETTFSRENFSE